MLPAASTATPLGLLTSAAAAGPPSPPKLGTPVPANAPIEGTAETICAEKGAEPRVGRLAALAVRVYDPMALRVTLLNVATPWLAVTGVVPPRAAPAGLFG